METKKITNWFNWKEWKAVVDDAYNEENDIEMYRRALSRIIAWESRDQNVPPALICLKELLIAKLYQIDKYNSPIEQIYWYQSSLSMNIVRFVNFITEPYQTGIFARAIKTIAIEIGIPDWIVNLRHNATHFSLPSVEVLESAREYLYKWLKERYVDTYKEIAVEQSLVQNIREYIQNIFVDYMNERYKTTLMKSRTKPLKDKSDKIDLKIDLITNHFKNETFEVLLENGYMIPTKEQLNAIGIVPEEFLDEEDIDIPKTFLNIWMEFLVYCNRSNNLIGILFQKLIETYRTEADHSARIDRLREKFLLSWIFCLIKLNSFKNEKSKFSKFQFEYNLKETLLNVLKGKPGKYCLIFLNEIGKLNFIKSLIEPNQFEKLLNLTILITQQDLKSDDQIVSTEDSSDQMQTNDQFTIYNLDMFEYQNSRIESNDKNMFNFKDKKHKLNSDWKLIDDVDWNYENLKLGLVEGQTYESLNLDMSQFLNKKDLKQVNEFDISINEPASSNKKHSSILNETIFDEKSIESIRKSVMNNYWHFS